MMDDIDPDFDLTEAPTPARKVLEKDIERTVCRVAREEGWYVRKFTSPAHRSVPDRLFIKRGRVVFIEFKRPGGKTTPGQDREIERLRAAGVAVYVCDSVHEALDRLYIVPRGY